MLLELPPVTFVGGKGGVGKTTVAAALAVASADEGRRTLLVSTDPAHSTSDVLGAPLGPEPEPVPGLPSLHAMEVDARAEADAYIRGVKERIRQVASPRMLKEVEREVDIARASPGAEEAAVFDRFARLMTRTGPDGDYDRVLFDTAPTGHTLRLLALPEHMEAWVDGLVARRRKLGALGRMWRSVAGAAAGSEGAPGGGERGGERGGEAGVQPADPVMAALERRQARFRVAREIVTDPARAGFLFVLVPERLPILETRRAVEALGKYRIPVLGVVVNRVLPGDADGRFLARRREREAGYLAEIDDVFRHLPRRPVPLRAEDPAGLDALRTLAADLCGTPAR